MKRKRKKKKEKVAKVIRKEKEGGKGKKELLCHFQEEAISKKLASVFFSGVM